MKEIMATLVVLAAAIATYIYLDWSVLQIIGVAFLVLFASQVDEKGPVWRKTVWAMVTFSLTVLGHFFVSDNALYWIESVFSALLFALAAGSLIGMLKHKPGDGSTLTVYFLSLVISLPIALLLLYKGMTGLRYW